MSEKKKVKEKAEEPFVLQPIDNNCSKGYHYVVIKEREISAITRSGIILPSGSKTNSEAAMIVSVAPECGCGLKVGDIILSPHMAGFPVTIQGEQYKIVSERDITCRYDTTRMMVKQEEAKQEMNKQAAGQLTKV